MNIASDKSRSKFLICLFLVIVTFISFSSVIRNNFINFDDDIYIYNNNNIVTGLSLKNIIWAFTGIHALNYHPLTTLSHMLDCQFFGTNPHAHHFVNLIFHIFNVLLLFAVLNLMTERTWTSAFVAALFAIHPMHVESVAWVSERKDTLSTLFWLLVMLFYFYYASKNKKLFYVLALTAFALGLLAKPMLVTLPFVLLLLDFWPLNRFQKRQISKLLIEKIPFLLMSAGMSFITFMVQAKMELVKSLSHYSVLDRLANAILTYVIYIEKLFWPVDLSIFYPHLQNSISFWRLGQAVFVLVVITILSLLNLRRRPYIAAGWFWFLGTLIPVIGIFQVGLQGYADRYTYVPYIGLFILITWFSLEASMHLKYRTLLLSFFAVIILSALGVKSFIQTKHWRNSISLYKHSINAVKNNWWAHEMLGNAYVSAGQTLNAISEYKKTLEYDPQNIGVQNRLAQAYIDINDVNQAIAIYEKILPPVIYDSNEPNDITYYSRDSFSSAQSVVELFYENANMTLAKALERRGNIDQAIIRYKEILRVSPGSLTAHKNLGNLFLQKGHVDKAAREFSAVIQLQQDSILEYIELAKYLTANAEFQNAGKIYEMIIYFYPSDFEANNGLGIIFAQMGNLQKAEEYFAKVTVIAPDFAGGFINLGHALNLQGEIEQAKECYLKAVQLDSDSALAQCRLGQVLLSLNDIDSAIKHLEKALQINPNYSDARNSLDAALSKK